jgi:hypothetical protein
MFAAQPLEVFSFPTGSLNHAFFQIVYGYENLPLNPWRTVIWEKY